MDEYDATIAEHYAAYRPPLHQLILQQQLKITDTFQWGLDIGCGTGHSAVALAEYCDYVIGVDPSQDMLEQAIPHPKITYKYFDGKRIAYPKNQFSIVTFAGSLFYAKSQAILDEVIRVCHPRATIVVYDFNIHLEPVLAHFDCFLKSQASSRYNHFEDFSGLNQQGILRVKKKTSQVTFHPKPAEPCPFSYSPQRITI